MDGQTYTGTVTREGSDWLADVPALQGAQLLHYVVIGNGVTANDS